MEQRPAEYENRLNVIRSMQLAELELIRLFVNICEKEHLMYYMLGGTMLGAVRHKGYIPWDDDADFGMPREDYERFLQVGGNYLPEYIKIETFQADKFHREYAAQMVNISKKVSITKTLVTTEKNLWIDIFPLDGMPNNAVVRKLHQIRLLLLRKLFLLSEMDIFVPTKCETRSWYNRLGFFVCSHIPIQKLLSPQKRFSAIEKALRKYPYEHSEYNLNMMGAYKFKEMFHKKVFGKGTLYLFEDMKLRGPEDYDFYLSQLYGDYMTPPSNAEWEEHLHFSEIKENDE